MPSGHGVMTKPLSLPDELVLTLLNEESGYFRQVPGWTRFGERSGV